MGAQAVATDEPPGDAECGHGSPDDMDAVGFHGMAILRALAGGIVARTGRREKLAVARLRCGPGRDGIGERTCPPEGGLGWLPEERSFPYAGPYAKSLASLHG